MDLQRYLREIEALVQHLSRQAGLLGDMDLHVIEQFFEQGVPLEAALAGIRKGAERLQRLKRPPQGLPLRRVQGDVKRELKRFVSSPAASEVADGGQGDGPMSAAEDDSWRAAVLAMAAGAPATVAPALLELAGTPSLGEERAFVRFLRISGDYYQQQLEDLTTRQRETLVAELAHSARAVLAPMSPLAREELLEDLARRRLASEDPVLEPRRFWQD